jgi:glyoxylate carboligase
LKRKKVNVMLITGDLLFGFMNKKKDQRKKNADEYTRGNRQVHLKIAAVDDDVARQLPRKWCFRKEVDDQPDNKN